VTGPTPTDRGTGEPVRPRDRADPATFRPGSARDGLKITGAVGTGTGPAGLPRFLDAGPQLVEQPRRAWVEQVMGMPVSLHVRGPLARGDEDGEGDTGPVAAAVEDVIRDLHRTDEIFSTYRPDSQLSRLRRGELALAQADAWVREVAELCDEARTRTQGWFDAFLPGPDGVRAFDPTGLVKGWAIERVTRRLSAALAGHDVLVNAGGDIAVRCRRTDTPDWALGIEDPADRSRLLVRAPIRTGAMATSGNAARGAHILDPVSGRPAAALASVTMIGPDLMWADVHATAAFAQGPDCVERLAGLRDHLAFVVFLDGTATTVAHR
jgi:FAD:protein FMN transferase